MKKVIMIILCVMHCALCIDLKAQESTGGTLSGSVIDENGEPVIGAEIFWLNSTIGAVTDIDGNFTIPMTVDSHHLVFNYLLIFIVFESIIKIHKHFGGKLWIMK